MFASKYNYCLLHKCNWGRWCCEDFQYDSLKKKKTSKYISLLRSHNKKRQSGFIYPSDNLSSTLLNSKVKGCRKSEQVIVVI